MPVDASRTYYIEDMKSRSAEESRADCARRLRTQGVWMLEMGFVKDEYAGYVSVRVNALTSTDPHFAFCNPHNDR